MTQIVESTYTQDAHEQQDGSVYTTERHLDDLGRVMTFGPYLCAPGMDPATVMALRATRINAEFALREAETEASRAGRAPWSKLEFRDQLGAQVEYGMDAFFASFESNPGLTVEQKAAIRTGYRRFEQSHFIERPLRPEVLSMLGLLKLLGLVTQEKIDAVAAAAEV